MSSATKDKIIELADQLFYEQGFEHSSFANIAKQMGISRGNFYHHFKSKDDILNAVIEKHLSKTQGLLEQWQSDHPDAISRIQCFINILIMNRAKITLYGCPVGTLTTELSKLDHPALDNANEIFLLFKNWLQQEFLHVAPKEKAETLAMHLLARSQGIATLASAFHDEAFLYQEVETLNQWLNQFK